MLKPFREWIESNEEIILCEDADPSRIYNAIMVSRKNIPNFMDAIYNIVDNVRIKTYQYGTLGITGPNLVTNHFNIYPKKLKHLLYHGDWSNNYKNTPTILKKTSELLFYKFYKGYYQGYLGNNHYSTLFYRKESYYKSKYQIGEYLIYLYPYDYSDTFIFRIVDDKLIVQRTDQNSGWGQVLKVNIINQYTNKNYLLKIGNSSTPTKEISIPKELLVNN